MNRRIAILTHSTNPRGGVVHAMQLAEALCDAGEDATLIAPDASGRGFFRKPRCPSITIEARAEPDLAVMVPRRIDEVAGFLAGPRAPRFDLYHSHDSITANALADLTERGVISGFARTVHHLDHFADMRQAARQARGVALATSLGAVSRLWRDRLQAQTGRAVTLLGNGVDTARYTPKPDPRDASLRQRLGVCGDGPVILTLGGVEARKNTLATMQAAASLRPHFPTLRLLIAGGASLLDHSEYRARFAASLRDAGAADMVVFAGIVPDEDMPSLYRLADVFAQPSLMEGFGLCALEAMASGCVAVVSDIAPYTEHLGRDDVLWADPDDLASISAAFARALDPSIAATLRRLGPVAASRFGWDRVARAHRPLYATLAERCLHHA